ncbi:MAG: thiamine-binding protein, partial [candidate division Zixibacteria bacterium]|nr:thiamine-binding protein [candidate division Zixibacteria bacterium]
HEMGAPRISTTIRLGTRTDRVQTMEEKIESVERKLRDESSS